MQVGLSGRAFVHFLIFELVLLGLLALIGQVPWWMWFVASALLLAALWTYDHKVQLAVLARQARPTQLVTTTLAAALMFMLVGGLLTFALLQPKRAKDAVEASPKAAAKTAALNQSLLSVMSVATERRHDPLRLAVTIANLGRLPTLKAFIGMDVIISEADQPPTDRIAKLFDTREHRESLMGQLTLVPGQIFPLALWHEGRNQGSSRRLHSGKEAHLRCAGC